MKADCIFCKIAAGIIPSKKILENDQVFVIADLHPQAKKHFLVIPKLHVDSLVEAFSEPAQGAETVGELFTMVDVLAKQEGLLPGGFRSVINTGSEGGQTVFHLHLHVLGGEALAGTFA